MNPSCHIFLGLEDGEPVGQVRFDTVGPVAEIDISIVRERRGNGLGIELLRLGLEAMDGMDFLAIAGLGFVLAIPNLTGPVPIGWGLLAVSVLGALGGLGVMEMAVRGRR